MNHVIKIKYEDTLCRLTFQSTPGGDDFSYRRLETRIRDLFKFPAYNQIRLTYTDEDGDVVAMADDQDLVDALIIQSLNPLRLHVKLVDVNLPTGVPISPLPQPASSVQVNPVVSQSAINSESSDQPIRQILKAVTPEPVVQSILFSCEPLKGASFPPLLLSELVEMVVKEVSSQLSQIASVGKGVETAPSPTFDGLDPKSTPAVHVRYPTPEPGKPIGPVLSPAPEVINPEARRTSAVRGCNPASVLGKPTGSFCSPAPEVIDIGSWLVPASASKRSRPVGVTAPQPSSPVKNDCPMAVKPTLGLGPSEVASLSDPFIPDKVGPENPTLVIHTGVQCDICGMTPIVGPRFKSIKKHDFDLCVNCLSTSGSAVTDYTRIDRPLFRPRHLHPSGTGRMRCPASSPNVHFARCTSVRGNYGIKPDCRYHHGGSHHHLASQGSYGGKLDARFVQDVTIVDGTELAPGTHFTKIWRLRNSGSLPWAPQTKLVHVGGDELGSVFVVPLELPEHGLLPNEETEASVDLIAPEKPGRYVSHWRLASPSGPKFGHRVWVLIQVVSNESSVSVEVKPLVPLNTVSYHARSEESSLTSPASSDTSRETFVKASHEAFVTQIQTDSKSTPASRVSVSESFPYLSMGDMEGIIKVDHYPVESIPTPVIDQELQTPGIGYQVLHVPKDRCFNDLTLPLEKTLQSEVSVGENSPPDSPLHEEVVAVESSDLGGGFSMVSMLTTTNSSGPSAPRSESHKPKIELEEKDSSGNFEEAKTRQLLAKLKAMGFEDPVLNLGLLVKNEMSLPLTLDDLFFAAEWDPILVELKEMGFYDTAMNRRLMFKNNGSVKRVVKELVQMYKEPAGKGKVSVSE